MLQYYIEIKVILMDKNLKGEIYLAGKMKKNGFVEGAVIAYIAIVITKILGAFYNIPFYGIIGERGSIIYSFAYSIYVLFLDIST